MTTESGLSRALETPLTGLKLAGSTMISAVFASAYLIGAARVLGSREFSDLAVCLSLSYVAMLFLGPLNLTLIRFSSVYRSGNDPAQIRPLLWHAARLYAPWVTLVVIASVVFQSPLARLLRVDNATLIPATGVVASLGLALGALRAVALGLAENQWYSRSVLLDAVVRFAVGGALVLTYRSAFAAMAGFVIGNAVALITLMINTRRRLPAPQREWTESAEVRQFMTGALVFSALVALLQNIDMVIAKMRLVPEEAGDYAMALAVARGFLLLAAPFSGLALAQTRSTEQGWTRILRAPAATYAAVCVAAVAVLWLAPAQILTILYGGATESQAGLLPLVSLAYAVAGAFLIQSQSEIHAGRFGFLAPLLLVFTGQVVALFALAASAQNIAWIVLGANVLAVACTIAAPVILREMRRFEGSAKYWDARYARGGASGVGSVGKFAEFKAEVLNGFVQREHVQSVIEFGCGDGSQLSLAHYPHYVGFDVSPTAVEMCRRKFAGDTTKEFLLLGDYRDHHADLTLSLDVIYHLVEDEVFDAHMRTLFDASRRWVIVYASNRDHTDRTEAKHVRHRQFTRWVEANRPDWKLRETIKNRYPYAGDYRLGSFADFFVFQRS